MTQRNRNVLARYLSGEFDQPGALTAEAERDIMERQGAVVEPPNKDGMAAYPIEHRPESEPEVPPDL